MVLGNTSPESRHDRIVFAVTGGAVGGGNAAVGGKTEDVGVVHEDVLNDDKEVMHGVSSFFYAWSGGFDDAQ